jgi:gliding motility-associated protein GldE
LETEPFFLPYALVGNIHFLPVTFGFIVGIIVLVMLLLSSALVSGSEVAYFSLSPSEKMTLDESKRKNHQIIRNLLHNPEKLLAAILVANNFINVGIIILSTYLAHSIVDFSESKIIGFIIEVVLITFILLLFGEIIPKIYASNYSLPFAELMSRPLSFSMKLFSPLIFLLVRSTSFVNKLKAREKKNLSIDNISHALELTSEEELSDDKGILEGIVKFGSTSVDQVMTPRIDLVALEVDDSPDKLLNIINGSGYSRIPVFSENPDNIEGILYVKDLMPHLNKLDSFRWQSLMRPPYFVPENKKIDDLLLEFQKAKVHMAIVVDEYGGTSGIVTLEDVLEEIVGDIVDEFDDDDRLFSKMNENTYIFDGKIQLNDFFRTCNIESTVFDGIKGEADTLAGLILEMKNDFPKLNEKLIYKNFEFTVESIDKRRIKRIKVLVKNTSG